MILLLTEVLPKVLFPILFGSLLIFLYMQPLPFCHLWPSGPSFLSIGPSPGVTSIAFVFARLEPPLVESTGSVLGDGTRACHPKPKRNTDLVPEETSYSQSRVPGYMTPSLPCRVRYDMRVTFILYFYSYLK